MDVFSTELKIRLSLVKTSEFRGGVETPKPLLGTPMVDRSMNYDICLFVNSTSTC
jgi:hypothetical protein